MTTQLPGPGREDPGDNHPAPDFETIIAELVEERRQFEVRDRARSTWQASAVVVACIALLGSILAVSWAVHADRQSNHLSASAGPASIAVGLSEFKITPASFSAHVGDTLDVTNHGTVQHQLTIQGTTLATALLNPGQSASLDTSSLSPGSYTVYCNVPGHRSAGMQGTLTLTAASGGSSTMAMGSGSSSSSTAGLTPDEQADGMTMTPAAMEAVMKSSTLAFPAKTAGLGGQPLAPTLLPDGTKRFDLTAEVVNWEVSPGKFVKAWTYNGTVPGPTIRVAVGDKVMVVLHNQLPEATTIHFHGLVVPFADDGTPYIAQPPVEPGQDFTYSFVAKGPAIGMYHSHFDATLQVESGMAGAFYVGDMPLPQSVVSQGVTQSQIAQYEMFLNDSGNIGLSINGKSFPATAPIVATQGQWIEVTYFNEGQMIHPMHLHEEEQMIIAQDGEPLATPTLDDTIMVAPGQRITILVHAVDVGIWVWHCHILQHAEGPQGMFGMLTALIVKAAA